MKIAFLSFYSGIVFRGVETFVHEVANKLVDYGHEVIVYQIGDKLPAARYKTVTIPIELDWNEKGSYFPFLNYYGLRVKRFTVKVLKQIADDTQIVFPTNGQWQSLLCSFWAKIHGKKVVISGQSGAGFDDKINIYTFPDIFFGLTDFQVSWAKRINPFVKVEKIPNGVDLSKFTFKSQTFKNKKTKKIKTILCVAAFDEWKRQDLLIKAVSKLKDTKLILVGKGAEEAKLKSLGDKLLPGRFEIKSFKHSDMPKVYKEADLFSFPTVPWESFGIVLVEAMASNLPIVCTNDPVRREIVGDAGIFIDPDKTEDYAKALKAALNTNWGNKPRKQAEKFSWDEIARRYEEIFVNL